MNVSSYYSFIFVFSVAVLFTSQITALSNQTSKFSYRFSASVIPVVYITFLQHGEHIPQYMRVGIEMASIKNRVIVLIQRSILNTSTPLLSPMIMNMSVNKYVRFEFIESYFKSAGRFSSLFVHLNGAKFKNHANNASSQHELRYIQRWFILKEFMHLKGYSKVFFSTDDNVVYANITHISAHERPQCSAILNIADQTNNFSWIASGESSMWTFNALDDFCRFTTTLYAHHLNILRLKSQSGGMVVDMNLFWLWWVAHRRNSSDIWGNGNPFYSRNPQAFTQAIGFANSLHLPIVNGRSLRICNGMDVVDRAVFDHRHGWKRARRYSIDLDSRELPYAVGVALTNGGRPEDMHSLAVLRLQYERLYFNSVHYQGNGKKKLVEDVCGIITNARFTSPPPSEDDTARRSRSYSSSSSGSSSKNKYNDNSKPKKGANDYVIKDSDVQTICESYYLSRQPIEDPLSLHGRHDLEKKTVTTFILGTIVRWILHYMKL